MTTENTVEARRRIPVLLRVPARVHWLSVGGESGTKVARYMDPDWARDLRDQCRASDAGFFFKQMTKRAPVPADLRVREYPGRAFVVAKPEPAAAA